jgi:hypothetical protein
MAVMSTHFTMEKAPCGRSVDGDRHREDDDSGLVIDDLKYACGCRSIRHEYHDGSFRIRTTRHDGKVLSDEHSADHEG